VGKLSGQAKQVKTAAPLKTILGSSHIRTRAPRQLPDSLLRTSKMIFLAWVPHIMQPNPSYKGTLQ
jgi:hypothetical protein